MLVPIRHQNGCKPVPSLTIKNLPSDLYERLKRSAKSHHRSINGEVIATLERSLRADRLTPEAELAGIRVLRESLNVAALDPDEISAAIHEGRT